MLPEKNYYINKNLVVNSWYLSATHSFFLVNVCRCFQVLFLKRYYLFSPNSEKKNPLLQPGKPAVPPFCSQASSDCEPDTQSPSNLTVCACNLFSNSSNKTLASKGNPPPPPPLPSSTSHSTLLPQSLIRQHLDKT